MDFAETRLGSKVSEIWHGLKKAGVNIDNADYNLETQKIRVICGRYLMEDKFCFANTIYANLNNGHILLGRGLLSSFGTTNVEEVSRKWQT
jgi:hypothetical protein